MGAARRYCPLCAVHLFVGSVWSLNMAADKDVSMPAGSNEAEDPLDILAGPFLRTVNRSSNMATPITRAMT
jgi:hypothetical protein